MVMFVCIYVFIIISTFLKQPFCVFFPFLFPVMYFELEMDTEHRDTLHQIQVLT